MIREKQRLCGNMCSNAIGSHNFTFLSRFSARGVPKGFRVNLRVSAAKRTKTKIRFRRNLNKSCRRCDVEWKSELWTLNLGDDRARFGVGYIVGINDDDGAEHRKLVHSPPTPFNSYRPTGACLIMYVRIFSSAHVVISATSISKNRSNFRQKPFCCGHAMFQIYPESVRFFKQLCSR